MVQLLFTVLAYLSMQSKQFLARCRWSVAHLLGGAAPNPAEAMAIYSKGHGILLHSRSSGSHWYGWIRTLSASQSANRRSQATEKGKWASEGQEKEKSKLKEILVPWYTCVCVNSVHILGTISNLFILGLKTLLVCVCVCHEITYIFQWFMYRHIVQLCVGGRECVVTV